MVRRPGYGARTHAINDELATGFLLGKLIFLSTHTSEHQTGAPGANPVTPVGLRPVGGPQPVSRYPIPNGRRGLVQRS